MESISTEHAPEGRRSRVIRSESRATVVACLAFALFALNFGAYRVFGDGDDYYSFVQKLFGDRPSGSGYNFGTGLMNAPFYGAARVLEALGGPARGLAASITVASIVWALLAIALSAGIVAQLQLRSSGTASVMAAFGTPLWYYASFSPSYTHAADAAAFSLAAAALLRVFSGAGVRWQLGCGAALGLLVAVRPFNAAAALGAVIGLAVFRRTREAVGIALTTAACFAALLGVPLALGTSLRRRADGQLIAGSHLRFSPLTPVRMLFTEHRGLFLWSPLAVLAVVGIVLLLRRNALDRPFVVTLTLMVVLLLASYAAFAVWDGGWSYSARYLAAPLPFYALGVAAVLDAASTNRRGLAFVRAGIALCIAYSVFLGMNHAFGARQSDGAGGILAPYVDGRRTVGDFLHLTWSYSRVRHLVGMSH